LLASSFLRCAIQSSKLKRLCCVFRRFPLTRLMCICIGLRPRRLHDLLCILGRIHCTCCIGGASYWGFAQETTTNGVLSLDSPFGRSVEWQQLARRTSPPKGLGRARNFRVPATTRAAPDKGVQGQPPAGARWISEREMYGLTEPTLIRTADRRFFVGRILWPGGERENRSRDDWRPAQGVHSC
jgi:hypothetical protein